MSAPKLCVAVLVLAASITAPAAKSSPILNEADGNFSASWVSPTVVASGTTSVSGSGAPKWLGGDPTDVFYFSGLVPGATSMVFDFSLTGPYNQNSYLNGGGSIYYSYVPFTGAYYVDQGNGKILGSQALLAGNFDVTYNPWEVANSTNRGTSSFTLNLANEFSGDLFLALDFNYGQVSYNINTYSWATSGIETAGTPSAVAVPLPATGWLLMAGLLGLIVTRRKTWSIH